MLTTHFVDARPGLHVVRSTLVLADVDCASVVTSLAEATAFGSRASISNIDVLCDSVSFEASLCLN